MIAVQFFYPLTGEDKYFSPENYVTHMRLCKGYLGEKMGKAFVYKTIPGAGYNAPGMDSRPQYVATGIVYYDSLADYERYFLTSLPIFRQDVKNFSEIRAYANVYEVLEVPEDPLNPEEESILHSYIDNIKD